MAILWGDKRILQIAKIHLKKRINPLTRHFQDIRFGHIIEANPIHFLSVNFNEKKEVL